ncbi:MAG: hypothetical protein OXI46_03200 [Gemmatimonadota bacterium]|nr:hypothetical protein [Gemmatimonadota bacterium]
MTRVRPCAFIALLLAGLHAGPALAQRVAPSVHVGTLGLGARVTVSLGEWINFRGGMDFVPLSVQVEEEGVDFDVKFPSPSTTALLDLHPGGGDFRLSAGAVYFRAVPGIEGTPTDVVELGDSEYTPAEVGTIRGSLGTSRVAPYLGVGVGNAPEASFGFALDLGAAFHGTPDFSYEATGPASGDARFRSDLREEAELVNDDIPAFASVYPVLNLGFSFRP